MTDELRIVIEDEHFRDLVAGKEVGLRTAQRRPVKMILADIGWARMYEALRTALVDARVGGSRQKVVQLTRIWMEDDATPGTEGHEDLAAAVKRLFDVDWRCDTLESRREELRDDGDAIWYRIHNGNQYGWFVVCASYPGNNSIYLENRDVRMLEVTDAGQG